MFTANYIKQKIIFYISLLIVIITFFSLVLIDYIENDSVTLTIYITNIATILFFAFILVRALKILLSEENVLTMDNEGILFLPLKYGPLKIGKIKWEDIESAKNNRFQIKFIKFHLVELKLKNEALSQFKKSKILYFLFKGTHGLNFAHLDKTLEEIYEYIYSRINKI